MKAKTLIFSLMIAGLMTVACSDKKASDSNNVEAMSGEGSSESTVSDGIGTQVDTITAIDKEAEDSINAQPAP